MTMHHSLSSVFVENSIERLNLPAFHPRAFPINERRSRYMDIVCCIVNLYDYSAIDEFTFDQLTTRALNAYVHGGF